MDLSEENPRSALLHLKEYPPEAIAGTILDYLGRYARLRSPRTERIDVSDISPQLTSHWAALVRRYDAWTLKRFAPPKRYAILTASVESTISQVVSRRFVKRQQMH